MPEQRLLLHDFFGLARIAVRSFAFTLGLLILVGIALAVMSYNYLQSYPVFGFLAALLVFAESFLAGLYLAGQRAIARTLLEAENRFHVGQSIVSWFGAWVASHPGQATAPEQVDVKIRERVTHYLGSDQGKPGFFRRLLQNRLIKIVQTVVLGRFRTLSRIATGVQAVHAVSGDMQGGVEAHLKDNLWTINLLVGIVLVGLVVLALLQTWGLAQLALSAPRLP